MLAIHELKSPIDFSNHEDWEQYVLETVAAEEVAYALELGRTRRFLRFYELRDKQFPVEFTYELDQAQALTDPNRTVQLRALNGRIFATMINFLMQPAAAQNAVVIEESPCQEIQRLLDYVGETNPWFALWVAYKNRPHELNELAWGDCVRQTLKEAPDYDIEFALLMSQLGELLHLYRDNDRALPRLFFQRIWFLHYCRSDRSVERNLQARALVQGLLEAMDSCAFA
jgi:hypothetical protein